MSETEILKILKDLNQRINILENIIQDNAINESIKAYEILKDLSQRINILENIIQDNAINESIKAYEFDDDDNAFLDSILGKDYRGV